MEAVKRLITPLVVVLMLTASHHDAAPSKPRSAHHAAREALDRGEIARAVQLADRAIQAAGTRRDAEYYALRTLRAELSFRQGDAAQFQAIIREPLPPQFATSEAAVFRQILLVRARRELPASLRAARAIAEKHQPHLLPAVANAEIGAGLVTDDQLDAATRAAITVARRFEDGSAEARLKAARGFRLVAQQRFADAMQSLSDAAGLAEKLRLVPTAANAHGNLGWAYWELGDLENAAEYFARAERATRERGLVEEQTTWLLQVGNIAYARRDYATAAQRYAAVLALARRVDSRWNAAHAAQNLAVIALREGRIADARRFHQEALTIKTRLKDDAALARAEMFSARLLMHERRYDEAQKLLERVATGTKSRSVEGEARAGLADLYLQTKQDDRAEAQFREAIATVREVWKEIAADRRPGASELRLSFLTRAIEILNSYLDFLISRDRIEDALAAADAYRAQTMEEELGVSRPRTLDAKAIARNANATILSYWLSERGSYLWVITPDRVTLHELPSDTKINVAVDAYQRQLHGRGGTLALSGARGQALYDMLVGPAGPFARNARVVVVPDGRLHNINFETLVVPGPNLRYWIEDVIVTNAGSLQMLAGSANQAPQAPKMLLVGDPLQADPSFGKLPNAAREVDAIARQFPSRVVLRGPNATPSSYFAAKPEGFDYLHFVAHGVAMRQKPLDSAVILGRDKSSDQYRLTAREIVERPRLRARLVTISSCDGAGSRAYSGEGLVGLAWAFLSAGADQVIAALWQVDDAATAGLMEQMYAGIRQGHDPASALRAAKLRMVRSGTIHAKASYWAPFVLYD